MQASNLLKRRSIRFIKQVIWITWIASQNLSSYFFGVISFFIAPRFDQEINRDKVAKILIIKKDRIGDIVLAIPAIAAIKKGFPGAHLTCLVQPNARSLFEACPYIDNVISMKKWHEILRLRKKKFDLVVIFHPKSFWYYLTFYVMKIPYRVGYNINHNGFLLTTKVDYRHLSSFPIQHERKTYLDMVDRMGLKFEDKLELWYTAQDSAYIDALLAGYGLSNKQPLVGICPGGGDLTARRVRSKISLAKTTEKQIWPKDRFSQLADKLIEKYRVKVVFVGSRLERDYINQIVESVSNRVVTLAGQVNLRQLCALIKRCDFFVSNNTAPMHIAAALKTPVVSIFGDSDPEIWGSYGEGLRHEVVRKNLNCSPCQYPGTYRSYMCQKPICMELITVKEVMGAVERLLSREARRDISAYGMNGGNSAMIAGNSQMKQVNSEKYNEQYFLTDCGGFEEYKKTKGAILHWKLKRCLDLADVKEGLNVLDIGCGRGELAYHCALNKCKVTAIDYSQSAIEFTRQTISQLPEECQRNVSIRQLDAKHLDSLDEKFDVIFMADIVEHLYDWELKIVFENVRKLLNERGKVVLHTMPNLNFYRYAYPFFKLYAKFINPSIINIVGDPERRESDFELHVNEQSPQSLKRYLKGFDTKVWCEFHKDTFLIRILKKTSLKNYIASNIFAVAKLKGGG